MNKNNPFIIIAAISLFLLNSCGVCDPRPSDRFSFYITKNNQDIYNDTFYQKNQISLISNSLPIPLDTFYVSLDTIKKFSSQSSYSLFSNSGNYEYLLKISPILKINITLKVSEHKTRKCGSYCTIDKVIYDGKTAIQNNNIYAYQIKLD